MLKFIQVKLNRANKDEELICLLKLKNIDIEIEKELITLWYLHDEYYNPAKKEVRYWRRILSYQEYQKILEFINNKDKLLILDRQN